MMKIIYEMIGAFIACVGFAMIYQGRVNRLFLCGLGAGITWGVCALCLNYSNNNIFLSYMVAAAFGTIFAEVLARLTKAPATVYLILFILPMVPGGSLYYTTYNIITCNKELASHYANATASSALGIAVGLVIVSVLIMYYNDYIAKRRKTNKAQNN